MANCWVYHKTEKPRLVSEEEGKKLKKLDWADSPAAFVDLSGVMDLSNETEVQIVGEVMDEMTQLMNDAEAAQVVRGKKLRALAEKYEVEYVDVKTKDLRTALKLKLGDIINGDSD